MIDKQSKSGDRDNGLFIRFSASRNVFLCRWIIITLLLMVSRDGFSKSEEYYDFTIPWDDTEQSIIDMAPRVLDPPAGKHGYVVAQGDKLFFKDGTPVRLWGVGLTFSSSPPNKFPPDKETAKKLVRKLAKYGFNHVRFAGFDGTASEIHQSWLKTGQLTSDTLDRFDFFINELRKAGIYYSVSINNGLPGILSYYPDIPVTTNRIRYFRYKHLRLFHKKAIEIERKWIRDFYSHVNPYTGFSLARDPANVYIAAVNEDSIFKPYFTPRDDLGEGARQLLQTQFNTYLSGKYGTTGALETAWKDGTRQGLAKGEDLGRETVVLRGPSELKNYSDNRIVDTMQFLISVDSSFAEQIGSVLRDIGYKGIFTFTNNWNGYGAFYTNHSVGDYIDTHAYFDPSSPLNDANPTEIINSRSLIQEIWQPAHGRYIMARDHLNALTIIFTNLLADRPLVLSEWNHNAWSRYSYEGPILMQAYASFQGVPVLAAHTYFTHPHPDPTLEYVGNSFAISAHPVWMSIYPTLALAFAKNYIREPDEKFCWAEAVSERDYLIKSLKNGLAQKHLNLAIPLDAGLRNKLRKTLFGESACKPAKSIESDHSKTNQTSTGEMSWLTTSSDKTVLTINTDKYQAVAGSMSGQAIQLKDMRATMEDHGAVLAISLDDKPLRTSRQILVTVVGEWENNESRRMSLGVRDVILGIGSGPVRLQHVKGEVVLRSANRDVPKVYAVLPRDKMVLVDPVRVEKGADYVDIVMSTGDVASPWFFIEHEVQTSQARDRQIHLYSAKAVAANR
jgi:hypothetical protein